MFCIRYFLLFSKRHDNSVIILRLLRSVSRPEKTPKLLKGTVKTIENIRPDRITSSSDFIRDLKNSLNTNDEKEIEEAILDGDNFTKALDKYDYFNKMQKSEDMKFRSMVKKQIVKRKYFKSEIETNLLTYSAKEQIHYLHQLDPIKWTPEVLAESFPISVPGVKKLLKTKFMKKSSEKIKEHDLKVAERWEILKSGQTSPLISLVTERLWKEGKLSESNYSGNSNLPTISLNKTKVIENAKNREWGEYSTIIKKYINYKRETLLKSQNKYEEKNMSPRKDITLSSSDENKFISSNRGYHAPEELDGQRPDKLISGVKSLELTETDVQHHQFIENLKEESFNRKQKSNIEKEYQDWVNLQGTSQEIESEKNPYNIKEFFSPISKYEPKLPVLKRGESSNHAYMYDDDKVGYQHPFANNIRSKISIPKKLCKKGYTYKCGKGVYDDDGELLYKLPT